MSYPTLSIDEAERLYVAFRDDQLDDDDLADVTRYVEGPAIDPSRIESLAHILWEIVEGLEQGRNSGLEFERIAAPELHEHLSLSQVSAADAGFWRWLTFSSGGDLAALVKWRYGRNDKSTPKKYFGMGNVKESMYGYLWLRANAVYAPSRPDPYESCRRGDVDLWQSHIVRVDFGSVPAWREHSSISYTRNPKLKGSTGRSIVHSLVNWLGATPPCFSRCLMTRRLRSSSPISGSSAIHG